MSSSHSIFPSSVNFNKIFLSEENQQASSLGKRKREEEDLKAQKEMKTASVGTLKAFNFFDPNQNALLSRNPELQQHVLTKMVTILAPNESGQEEKFILPQRSLINTFEIYKQVLNDPTNKTTFKEMDNATFTWKKENHLHYKVEAISHALLFAYAEPGAANSKFPEFKYLNKMDVKQAEEIWEDVFHIAMRYQAPRLIEECCQFAVERMQEKGFSQFAYYMQVAAALDSSDLKKCCLTFTKSKLSLEGRQHAMQALLMILEENKEASYFPELSQMTASCLLNLFKRQGTEGLDKDFFDEALIPLLKHLIPFCALELSIQELVSASPGLFGKTTSFMFQSFCKIPTFILTTLGNLKNSQGKYEEALQILNLSQELKPNQPLTLIGIARAQEGLGQKEKASNLIEQAFYLEGHKKECGIFLIDQGKHSKALPFLTRALEQAQVSNDATLLLHLGIIDYELDNVESAIKNLERAYHLQPDDPLVAAWLGNVWRFKEKKVEAHRLLSSAVKDCPYDPFILARYGANCLNIYHYYYELKINDQTQNRNYFLNQALIHLKKANSLQPHNCFTLGLLGRVLMYIPGQLANSEKLLKEALQLEPDEITTLEWLIENLQEAGKKEEAELLQKRIDQLEKDEKKTI